MIEELDRIVRESLTELVEDVFGSRWYGREHELVSLYVLGHLQRYCAPDGVLRHPTQIGLEAAVRQIPGPNRKKLVCKDVVIWPEPGMTCWDESGNAVNSPAAVLEWKANKTRVSAYDVGWLCSFSAELPDFVGYAVCLDLHSRRFRLSCTRVHQGEALPAWLLLR